MRPWWDLQRHNSAFAPLDHGYAEITVIVYCPGGSTQTVTFCVYLDPSGTVNGSTTMSPANRTSTMVTESNGLYGWDVEPGYYEVQAQKVGCVSATTPAVPIADSPVLQIAPAVTGAVLTLNCTGSPATQITSAGTTTFTITAASGIAPAASQTFTLTVS